MSPKLTNEIINAAITGFEQQKVHIDAQIAELRAMLSGGTTEAAVTPELPKGERRKFSAAARKRMKEAQQLRWAKIRGDSEPAAKATPESPKPKRKLSAAGKANIVAALKKRWAAKKAAAATTKPAATAKKVTAKKSAVRKAPVKVAKKKSAKATQAATTAQ